MVVVGVVVADADDAKPLRATTVAVVRPTFELCLVFYVDILPREIIDHVVDCLSSRGMVRPPKSASMPSLSPTCDLLQPTHKVAVILIDQRKAAVLEVRSIKQNQSSLQPRSCLEQRAIVRFLISHIDPFNRLVGGIVEQVELRSSLLLVAGLKLIGEARAPNTVPSAIMTSLNRSISASTVSGTATSSRPRSTRSRRYSVDHIDSRVTPFDDGELNRTS